MTRDGASGGIASRASSSAEVAPCSLGAMRVEAADITDATVGLVLLRVGHTGGPDTTEAVPRDGVTRVDLRDDGTVSVHTGQVEYGLAADGWVEVEG